MNKGNPNAWFLFTSNIYILMKSNNSLAGLFVMLGLAIVGIMFPVAVNQLKSFDRTVDVKGLCEKEVMADKVIWPISHKAVGNDFQSVSSSLDAQTKAIVNFLKSNGVTADEISVSIPRIIDRLAQDYVNDSRGFRYLGKSSITVCSRDVAKILQVMGRTESLVNKGININQEEWGQEPTFLYESLNDIKPEMIAEATANARAAADKFAKDSDSKVGKIKSAMQGTFSIEDRDSFTPHIKKVRVVTYLTYYLNN